MEPGSINTTYWHKFYLNSYTSTFPRDLINILIKVFGVDYIFLILF